MTLSLDLAMVRQELGDLAGRPEYNYEAFLGLLGRQVLAPLAWRELRASDDRVFLVKTTVTTVTRLWYDPETVGSDNDVNVCELICISGRPAHFTIDSIARLREAVAGNPRLRPSTTVLVDTDFPSASEYSIDELFELSPWMIPVKKRQRQTLQSLVAKFFRLRANTIAEYSSFVDGLTPAERVKWRARRRKRVAYSEVRREELRGTYRRHSSKKLVRKGKFKLYVCKPEHLVCGQVSERTSERTSEP